MFNFGVVMFVIGLGIWQFQFGVVEMVVEWVFWCGYWYIDIVFVYGNEKEVGQGIRVFGVFCEEIWLIMKLDNDWYY